MRRLSALISILGAACFAVTVTCLLLAFAVPWPVSVPVLAATLAVAGLIVIANLRGSRPRPQPYATFESDALGHPVTERFLVPHAPVTRMLDALPGDAGAKRRFLCLTAARETSTALAHLVSTKSLTDICSGRPAYSIPREEVLDARLSRRSQSLILTAADDSYRYFFRNAHDLDRMWRELGDLGVAGAGGQG